MALAAAADEQSFILEDAFGFAAEQRFYLRRAIQHHDMEMALRSGLCLANELRSSQLLPENYYKLYALVFWELQQLAAFVASVELHGLSIAEVYELVQHEGNVLPRLYLLVTVGAVQIQAGTDVLDDLASMLNAVQHPMRGLFLRYYLLQVIKDKLEDLRGPRGALAYLLANLRESANLWARLRLEGTVEEPWRLDARQQTLRLLVGAHVSHMARMRSLNVELYSEAMLPELLNLTISCEDVAAQAYLLQCLVEALPEDFHLQTLECLLAALAQVHWAVDLRLLLQHLMQRLTAHVRSQPDPSPDVFGLFHAHLRQLHARPRSPALPLASLLELQVELGLLVLALHPGDAGRVEMVLEGTAALLGVDAQEGTAELRSREALDVRSVEAIVSVLASPLTQEHLVPVVLAMPHHARLMAALDQGAQRAAALAMVSALLEGDVALSSPETVQRMLTLVDCLIRDEGGGKDGQRHIRHDAAAFTAEQEKVAKLVHQVRHVDVDITLQMLSVLHGFFSEGGPHRMAFTLPALVVAMLRLASKLLDVRRHPAGTLPKTTLKELFECSRGMCERLGRLVPEECVRLWLLCASTCERASAAEGCAELGLVCEGFVSSGLACLEEKVSGSEARFRGLQLLVGTLRCLTCLRPAPFERVAERAVSLAWHLPTARLQSKALCLCSSLFWGPSCSSPGYTLGCLRAALQFADSAVHVDPMDVGLFVEILDEAVRHVGHGNRNITASFLSTLVSVCVEHLYYLENRAPVEAMRALHAVLADHHESQAKAKEEALESDGGYTKLELQVPGGLSIPAHA